MHLTFCLLIINKIDMVKIDVKEMDVETPLNELNTEINTQTFTFSKL